MYLEFKFRLNVHSIKSYSAFSKGQTDKCPAIHRQFFFLSLFDTFHFTTFALLTPFMKDNSKICSALCCDLHLNAFNILNLFVYRVRPPIARRRSWRIRRGQFRSQHRIRTIRWTEKSQSQQAGGWSSARFVEFQFELDVVRYRTVIMTRASKNWISLCSIFSYLCGNIFFA